MRPGPPGQAYPPAAGAYPAPTPQQHDPQRYYAPNTHTHPNAQPTGKFALA